MSAEHEDNYMPESPAEFTDLHRTMMYAADGDSSDYVDADTGKEEFGMPALTEDPRFKLMVSDDTESSTRKDLANQLVREYGLDTIGARVKEASAGFDEDRRGVISREADTAQIMIDGVLAMARGEKIPSYENRIQTVTGQAPVRIDPKGREVVEIRGLMQELLARRGYTTTNPKTLDRTVAQWEHDLGNADTSDFTAFQAELQAGGRAYAELLREKVLKQLDPALATLPFDGLDYKTATGVSWDAFLRYTGGKNPDGSPRYSGEFLWNVDRPAPMADVKYITNHETTHAIQAVVQQWLRQQGRLGSEAAFTTMASERAIMTEGLAQVAGELLSGGKLDDVIAQFGIDYALMMVQDMLQDMVRVYVGEQVELEGKPRESLKESIQTDFLQTPHIAHKYAGKGFWAGDMRGQMYAPSYYLGSRGFREALQTNSPIEVTRSAFFLNGFRDMKGFQKDMTRQSEVQAF